MKIVCYKKKVKLVNVNDDAVTRNQLGPPIRPPRYLSGTIFIFNDTGDGSIASRRHYQGAKFPQ